MTFSNGVFEHRGGRHIVYLPTYGIPELAKAGAEAHRFQGSEVRPVPVECVFRQCGTISHS